MLTFLKISFHLLSFWKDFQILYITLACVSACAILGSFFLPMFSYRRPLIFPSPGRIFPICCSRHHASKYILQYPGESTVVGRDKDQHCCCTSELCVHICVRLCVIRKRKNETERRWDRGRKRVQKKDWESEEEEGENKRTSRGRRCTPMCKRESLLLSDFISNPL